MPFTTRATLLDKIRLGSGVAWTEFHGIYRPLMLLRGADRGLRPEEKEDLVQDVLVSLFKGQERFCYDPRKGRFRDYLKKIIDRRAFDILRKRKPEQRELDALEADGAILTSTDQQRIEENWDRAWQRHLLSQALGMVRTEVTEKTYQAFEMYVVDEVDPKIVADTLHISVASVYVAKNRVLKRLRPILRRLEEE